MQMLERLLSRNLSLLELKGSLRILGGSLLLAVKIRRGIEEAGNELPGVV